MAVAADVGILDPWITQVRTRRGATVCIRPLRADDREREIAYLEGLSPRSQYFRLHSTRGSLPAHLIDQLMDLDYLQRMAFAATTVQGGLEELVAVARYGVWDEPGAAEFAVSVADAWQRSGIATALMKELMRYARAHEIHRLTGQILPDNLAMIALARRLGFVVRYDPAQHLFLSTCALNPAPVG